MKKLISILALSISTFGAYAAGPVVSVSYDLDHAGRNQAGFRNKNEVHFGVAQETALGTFDGALTGVRFNGKTTNDDTNGFEVGYSNGFSYDKVGISGRLGYGRLNNIDPNGGGFTGNASYWSAGVEAQAPITSQMNAFVGYRHRTGINSDTPSQNRETLGVDYALSKAVALRLGYAHSKEAGYSYNGLTSAISYNF